MSKTVISVKTDKSVRDQAKKIAKEMGIPLSTLLNAFLRQFIRTKEVTFNVEISQKMTKKFEDELAPIDADIKARRNLSKAYDDVDELFDDLDLAVCKEKNKKK